jgi:N-acetylglucosamine-6-phosphate deacetylase
MVYAGMTPGNYDSPAAGRVCLTEEGKLHIQGKPGLLAGSASTLPKGVNRMAELIPFPDAWDMGSVNASRLINPDLPYGLRVGAPADLVLLHLRNGKMEVSSVCKRGVPLEINE